MFTPKIKVPTELYKKLSDAAALAGCTSVQEFAEGVLQREAERILTQQGSKAKVSAEEVNEIASKLKGLGYLD